MKKEYLDEISKHIYPRNIGKIINLPLSEKTDNSLNCWINRNWEYESWKNSISSYSNFDTFYIDFYEKLFIDAGFQSPITTTQDFLFDHPVIDDFSEEVDEYDFLIINSVPFSGQWFYNEKLFDILIRRIKENGYSVITTKKTSISGVPCTMDLGYDLLQIGAQATKVNYVIGVHTSPWLFSLNKYSVNKVKCFICLQNQGLSYSMENVIPIKLNFNEIYTKLLNIGVDI